MSGRQARGEGEGGGGIGNLDRQSPSSPGSGLGLELPEHVCGGRNLLQQRRRALQPPHGARLVLRLLLRRPQPPEANTHSGLSLTEPGAGKLHNMRRSKAKTKAAGGACSAGRGGAGTWRRRLSATHLPSSQSPPPPRARLVGSRRILNPKKPVLSKLRFSDHATSTRESNLISAVPRPCYRLWPMRPHC